MPATNLPTASVVVPTRDRAAELPATLAPLLADPQPLEIVVVVDGGRDGSLELLERMAATDARLRPLWIENRGITGARLAGARAARGEVVVLLDDDVIAAPGLVAGHSRHHAQPGLVVVGYMPVARPARPRPGDFPREIYAREYERHCAEWERAPDSVLRSLWAGNMSLRREDLLRVAERIPAADAGYHDDLDFGLHCLEAGLRGRFDRALRAEHRYRRGPEAFVRDARNSGRSLAVVHRRHEAILGPLDQRFAEAGLPGAARLLVRAGRARPRLVAALLRAGVRVLGPARAPALERRCAGLLWRVEQQAAAQDALSV